MEIRDARLDLILYPAEQLSALRAAGEQMKLKMKARADLSGRELQDASDRLRAEWEAIGREIEIVNPRTGEPADGRHTWTLWCVLSWADESGWFDPSVEPTRPPESVLMLAEAVIEAGAATQPEVDKVVADIRGRSSDMQRRFDELG